MGAFSCVPEHIQIVYSKTIEEGTHLFQVRNEKSGGSYTVAVEAGTNRLQDCSCPHHMYRKKYCKHMKYVQEFLDENPRFLTELAPSRVLPSISAYDDKLINDIVSKYGERIKSDTKMRLYIYRCVKTWSKFQTQVYIEDIKYKFHDCLVSYEVLAHRLGIDMNSIDDEIILMRKELNV